MPTFLKCTKYAVVACCALFCSPAVLVLLRLVFCGLALLYCKLRINPEEHLWVTAGTASNLATPPGAATPVPRILHQIWLSPEPDIPARWQEAYQSCHNAHPQWEKRLWREAEARAFVAANYSWFLPTYNSYPYLVQRVDALRYMVLLSYGGIYLDLDVGCRMPLEPLRQYQLLLASTQPVGFANDVIAAPPNHPLIQAAVRELPAWNKRYGSTYPTVMYSTGPMFLNLLYTRHPEATAGLHVLPPHLYDGGWASFFNHYEGNSWHAADSAVIGLLHRYLKEVLVTATAAAACVVLLVVWACCGRSRVPLQRCLAGQAGGKRVL